jgi:hypothetical protein
MRILDGWSANRRAPGSPWLGNNRQGFRDSHIFGSRRNAVILPTRLESRNSRCFDEMEALDSDSSNPSACSHPVQEFVRANHNLRWIDWGRNRSEQCRLFPVQVWRSRTTPRARFRRRKPIERACIVFFSGAGAASPQNSKVHRNGSGTWNLDVTKSEFGEAPKPKSTHLTVAYKG